MSLLVARIVGGPRQSTRGAEDTLWIREAFVGARAASGATVTVNRGMHLDSVFAAVALRSRSVGQLPLKVYRRDAAGDRTEAWMEPVYELLHERPNREMAAVNLWTLVETHLSTWGNAYVGKEFDPLGRVANLWPLYPERMEAIERTDGLKRYRYRREDGRLVEYTDADLIHFMGLSLDGLIGISPIGYAREAIGAALSGQSFAGSFFENSAVPRGVLQTVGELSKGAIDRLRDQWNAAHRGRKNMHKVAVLEGGVEFKAITMPLEDAQFVEQAKLSVQAVARFMSVPPELIGGESGGSLTYSTVEGQGQHFLTFGLGWDLELIEQTCERDDDLFPDRAAGLYPEFTRDAFVRSDAKTSAEIDAMSLDAQKGWSTRAEVRRKRNLPPERGVQVRPPEQTRAAMAELLGELHAAREAALTNGGTRHADV